MVFWGVGVRGYNPIRSSKGLGRRGFEGGRRMRRFQLLLEIEESLRAVP